MFLAGEDKPAFALSDGAPFLEQLHKEEMRCVGDRACGSAFQSCRNKNKLVSLQKYEDPAVPTMAMHGQMIPLWAGSVAHAFPPFPVIL